MKKEEENQGQYVQKVRENTRQFTQDLMADNERLRELVASLEADRVRLQDHISSLREQLGSHLRERGILQQQVAEVEAENRKFATRYVEVEQQNANLANLYVASYRLHATLDREEVLAVIQEVIINLIGSEELGIFELSLDGSTLDLISSFGIDPARYHKIRMGSGLIGTSAHNGEPYMAGENSADGALPDEAELTACIPIKLGDRVTGAIAVFRLLNQKSGLEAIDQELFSLLATHAATALYCTSLHANAVREAA